LKNLQKKEDTMRKTAVFGLAAILVLLAASSMTYAAEPIKLTFSQYFPVTHKNAVLTGQFCEEIKKRTNGRVEIVHYAGGTLTTAPKVMDGVITGISDLGFSSLNYNPGRYPVTDTTDLPLGRPNGWVASQVSDDFYRKFKPKEWDKVHVLYLTATGPNVIQTVSKPVKTLADLKGVKLRGVGKMGETLKALGAATVPLEMVDLYESLRRGVIEGCMMPVEVLKGWKLGELEKYVTASWMVGNTNTFYVVMNAEKWNKLPADLKKIFDEVAAEFKEKHALAWNESDTEAIQLFKQQGGQITALDEAEAARWKKAVEPVIDEYKKASVSAGFKAAEVDGWISYTRERVAYWTKAAKEKNIKSWWQ
jgi:TRAP-type C4-dicarboxylate transport system substrate-binding protein